MNNELMGPSIFQLVEKRIRPRSAMSESSDDITPDLATNIQRFSQLYREYIDTESMRDTKEDHEQATRVKKLQSDDSSNSAPEVDSEAA